MGGPLTPLEILYPVCYATHMDALYLFTPVGLDLQLLRESGYYPVSRFLFDSLGHLGSIGIVGSSYFKGSRFSV